MSNAQCFRYRETGQQQQHGAKNGRRDKISPVMESEEEGEGSALGVMSRNWRSALVVNSLHDALEEAERQRDEIAQMLTR